MRTRLKSFLPIYTYFRYMRIFVSQSNNIFKVNLYEFSVKVSVGLLNIYLNRFNWGNGDVEFKWTRSLNWYLDKLVNVQI